jgi:hypothetical protein
MSEITLMRIGAFGFICLAIWLVVDALARGQSGTIAGALGTPAETVALLIETPQYDGPQYTRRRAALIEILMRQPGVKRIVAYAIGMGDHWELWSDDASPGTGGERDDATRQRREKLTRELERFIHETASNSTYSMSRIVQGMGVMMNNHAEWVEERFRSANSELPPEVYHLRLLAAAQIIDPAFRVQVPATSCRSDGDWDRWRRGILIPRQFAHFRNSYLQKVTVYSIYDAVDNKKLNRNVEAFFHSSLDRDGIGYGGIYYLDEPTSAPEPPRSQPGGETHVCDLLTQPAPDEYRHHDLADLPGQIISPVPQTAPSPTSSPLPPQAIGPRLVPPLAAPVPTPATSATPTPSSTLPSRPVVPTPSPSMGTRSPSGGPSTINGAPSVRIPETVRLSVASGQNIARRLVDLLGPDAAGIDVQRAHLTERAMPRQPGAGTLSGGVFRYVADADGQGEHTFSIDLIDAEATPRRVTLIVRVDRAASPASPLPSMPSPRPSELDISVSWSGPGIELEVHVFTPEYRQTSADIAVTALGHVTRDRPGPARFQPRRQESGTATEKVTFDRVTHGSYVAAVSVRAASLTSCQRGSIVVAYGIDPASSASYRRNGLQVGAAGSVTIPIVCDVSGRLAAPASATLVEVNPQ